eukprot:1184105-Prorocentrum_minimum.AAC.1
MHVGVSRVLLAEENCPALAGGWSVSLPTMSCCGPAAIGVRLQSMTRWLDKVNCTVSVSSPSGVRKELVGELNWQVMRWLDKALTISGGEQPSDGAAESTAWQMRLLESSERLRLSLGEREAELAAANDECMDLRANQQNLSTEVAWLKAQLNLLQTTDYSAGEVKENGGSPKDAANSRPNQP